LNQGNKGGREISLNTPILMRGFHSKLVFVATMVPKKKVRKEPIPGGRKSETITASEEEVWKARWLEFFEGSDSEGER